MATLIDQEFFARLRALTRRGEPERPAILTVGDLRLDPATREVARGATRIELSPQFTEVERAREKFSFAYIPEDVELLFREALTCFSQGAFNAFASMCRRTAQAMFADLGEAGRLRLFDELNAVRELADIAPEIFAKLKSVLFGAELDARSALPLFDGYEAGIMLEVVKDLLYEAYVRRGKLQQAIMVRRFFLDETNPNIAPLDQRAEASAG